MSMTLRVWTGVIVVAVLTVVGHAIYVKGQPTEVALPEIDLKELPTRLGTWVGTDTPLDPNVFQHSEAMVAVNRTYKNPGSKPIILHAALWDRGDITPHPPQECYAGVGYQLLTHRDLKVKLPGGGTGTVRYLIFERDHEDVYVLYWYHFGHTLVFDRDSLRSAQFAARDQKSWPAVTKVMLQTTGPNNEKTEEQLRSFAERVVAWTYMMYGPPPGEEAVADETQTEDSAPSEPAAEPAQTEETPADSPASESPVSDSPVSEGPAPKSDASEAAPPQRLPTDGVVD